MNEFNAHNSDDMKKLYRSISGYDVHSFDELLPMLSVDKHMEDGHIYLHLNDDNFKL